jgi:hypothetical protein
MPQPTDTSMTVEKVLDLLFVEVTHGLLYSQCAKSLHEGFQQSTLMRYSWFFFAMSQAAAREAVLSLSKLTKKQQDSVTVYYLFNVLEKSPDRFCSDSADTVRKSVAAHRERLDKYRPLLESVWEHRDRVVAHLDRKHITHPSHLFTHSDVVNFTELEACLRDLLDILNHYARYLHKEWKVSHLESFVSGDVDILVKWMCEHGKPEEWARPPNFGDGAD